MNICNMDFCTGCGMCVNICPQAAITMQENTDGFIIPVIDYTKCVECHLCEKKCPTNNVVEDIFKTSAVYAAWNKNSKIRKASTSGGVFSALAECVLEMKGAVVGVRWKEDFSTEHCIVDTRDELVLLYGSKYVQSNTGDIYKRVHELLRSGKMVLFSGTPCQNHALKLFLGKEYTNLIQVDFVCHGVPSYQLFARYLMEHVTSRQSKVCNVQMRYKAPYWDFCNVRIDFENSATYSVPTVDDPYFSLFNFGYSLRKSCHHCQYTNFNRQADITLMDFWGFAPKNFKMGDYNRGISCVLINSDKGKEIFEKIQIVLNTEESTIDQARNTNKCLTESFDPNHDEVEAFWEDYRAGKSVKLLHDTYVSCPIKKPNLLVLRRLKRRYGWLLKK